MLIAKCKLLLLHVVPATAGKFERQSFEFFVETKLICRDCLLLLNLGIPKANCEHYQSKSPLKPLNILCAKQH